MITQTEALEKFHLNPETGEVWRNHKNCSKLITAKNSKGYLVCKINNKNYLAHRIIWLMTYGSFPTDQIDHINGIKTDNRICNLREATTSQNKMNSSKYKNNTSGYKGVIWYQGKWCARIGINSKSIYLGCFTDLEEAAQTYKEAELKYFGEFANVVCKQCM